MDNQIIGLAAAYMVVEFAKFTIKTMARKKAVVTLNEKQSYYLRELHEMHSVLDADGRPIWYMPNQVGIQQEKIIEILNGMSKTQNDTTHVLERIIDKLDMIKKD